jgi:hypothetical protein
MFMHPLTRAHTYGELAALANCVSGQFGFGHDAITPGPNS